MEIQRDLGRHDAEIESLKDSIEELKKEVRMISKTLSEASGGWKTLMLVGGAASAIGAGVVKFSTFFGGN